LDQRPHLLATLGELADLAVPEGLPPGAGQAVSPHLAVHGLVGDAQPLGQDPLSHPFVQQGLDMGRGLAAEKSLVWTHLTIAARSPWITEGDTASACAMALCLSPAVILARTAYGR